VPSALITGAMLAERPRAPAPIDAP